MRAWQDSVASGSVAQTANSLPLWRREKRLTLLDRTEAPATNPARLILILSLAPTVGLGIGRFAYSLLLPDMRDSLADVRSELRTLATEQRHARALIVAVVLVAAAAVIAVTLAF